MALALLLLVAAGCGSGDGGDSPGSGPGEAMETTAPSLSEPVPLADEAWRPEPGVRWHIQYSGELEVPGGVAVVDLDMEETSAEVIEGLHDRGLRVVCYLSAGSWEPNRSDAEEFPEEVLGEGLEDER
ncbi:hypothetical protein BH24ACT4_BH24ACT4_14550 [soil metagenome]